jgi:single-strand DNA-binding protein
MLSLNRAQIIGHVTRDPEVRTTPTGQAVATIGVATNFRWKDQNGAMQDRTEFHNVVVWRKLAEIVQQYVKKGSRVYVEGRLQTRDWLDQQGAKKFRTEIVAENFIILDRKGDNVGGAPASEAPDMGGDAPLVTEAPDDEIKLEEVPF